MKPPQLPRPPRLTSLFPGGNPLREPLQDGRDAIRAMQEEIKGIRSALRPSTLPVPAHSKPPLPMPTTPETVTELKRRLAKELYRVELDLQGGARIAGKPCDCLKPEKHSGAVQATAEELMSYERNPMYGKVVDWFSEHAAEFEPEEIEKRPPDFYRALAPEVRAFRKAVMGTESVGAMLTAEERKGVKERLEAELEG